MKKIIIAILLILIVAISTTAYFSYQKEQDKTNELESKLDTASKSYFEKYISANDSANSYRVTLEDLEKANQNGENYDLKGLEKCNKTKTYADVTINYKTGKAKKTQVELKC